MAGEVYRIQRHSEHYGPKVAGKEVNIGQNGVPTGGDQSASAQLLFGLFITFAMIGSVFCYG